MENRKDLQYYMTLPYKIDITSDETGYTAILPELPGCMTSAAAFGELERLIREAKELWIQVMLEEGLPIPVPEPSKRRMP